MPDRNDDFYVGYHAQAPARLATWTRKVIVALMALAVGVPLLLAASQSEFADSVFEFGNVREFQGRITATPYPVLHDGEPHLLVAIGKHGVLEDLGASDGDFAAIRGQLIHRDGQKMIEVSDYDVTPHGRIFKRAPRSLGQVDVTGEIVGSKCYLGVMKPGSGKTHRDCAVRCISGGVPPMLLIRDDSGNELRPILLDREGRDIGPELLELVGRPIRVRGDLYERDDLIYLLADRTDYSRLERGIRP
jgi:hypothetical protein